MKKRLLVTTIAILMVVCGIHIPLGAQTQDPIPQEEKQALVDLFNATDGPNWNKYRRWDLSADVTKWKGVKIKDGHVIELNLSGFKLRGAIPASISKLTHVENLFLQNNQISGPLPQELFTLPNVKLLYMSNQRTPEDYENPREYTLVTPLPAVIDMPLLEQIDLSNNGITGPLSEMKTPKLQIFAANNCSLESLHPSLWSLPELTIVSMQHLVNDRKEPLKLKGGLPETFNCPKLVTLAISNAPDFGGPIPIALAKCTKLQQLLLQGNGHTGTIPKELGLLTELTLLSLSQNKLTGEIPKTLANLHKLNKLYLGVNELTGTIPDTFQELTELEEFNLKGAKLSGELPIWIGKLKKLVYLILGDNQFTGTIPAMWAPVAKDVADDGFGCPNLMKLDLANLQLTGELPERFKNFPRMDIIWLNGNKLSGDPTGVLAAMTTLSQIHIHHNNFTGSLKDLLSQKYHEDLVVLWAHNNHFSGVVEEREVDPTGWGPYYRFNKHGVNISYNDFVFKDFEQLSAMLIGEKPEELTERLTFAPQNKLPIDTPKQEIKEGESLRFVAPELEELNPPKNSTLSDTSNKYQWYKDGQLLANQTARQIEIASVTKDNAGVYTCKVTNPLIPGLTLETEEMIATVITGILPISQDSSLLQCYGDRLIIPSATWIALYSTSGELICQVQRDNISLANLPAGETVIVVYTIGDSNYAVKYLL